MGSEQPGPKRWDISAMLRNRCNVLCCPLFAGGAWMAGRQVSRDNSVQQGGGGGLG